ncbi:MAG: maltooligosyl trehalose synthase [Marmoricola sp.]|nr:maltooligosyl trehalose synthase [Marmoricola sp.]
MTRPGTRPPASTYRLQISESFTLIHAADRLAYLHDLGVDWVYLSPLLTAEPGSDHGYDVVDLEHVDPARGGAEGLAALSAEARRLGMGVLVDIVPNHVGVATPAANTWWWDVLRLGRDSPHADAFDIDWEFGQGRLRLPVLGDDDLPVDGGPTGHLEVVGDELHYYDQRFPIAPGTGEGTPDEVHAQQHYELISWRRGDSELNYRRFFSVNTLAGVRVERPEIFAATHAEIGRWFTEGLVDGLRVDHPDGLRDPRGYLDDLAGLTGNAFVLVEKILEAGEELPHSWATDGTTGYDVLALLDRVLTDPAGQKPLDALESRLRGAPLVWEQLVLERKRHVADVVLRAETNRIVRELPASLVEEVALQDAVAELLACFPVYRSYLPEGRRHLDEAFERARATRPDLVAVLDALAPVLGDPEAPAALRFQQTSGMVMAKGVEDCAFYRSSRLTSLNEVGADPSIFAITVPAFHEAMETRQREWPHAMTALSTHDTKRSEDVRARIAVLAELPGAWEEALDRLLALVPLPDDGFGALLWQAVLGAWPASVEGGSPAGFRDRLHAYAEKAMREAGDHTAWTDADTSYEDAVHAAVDAAFDDQRTQHVLTDLVERAAAAGWSNALAAKLVAITAPGVVDVYQGSELWEQSLVDPDNRRPVDFDRREALLGQLRDGTATVERPTDADDEGVAKLLLTQVALTLRRDRPELFETYRPLDAHGPAADHVLAFDRGGAITVVTRLPVGLAEKGGWGDTSIELPAGAWLNVLGAPRSSTTARLADLMTDLPVALLVKEA